ncbi:hypothetical protein CEQ90_02145 [Lewinellaceae bacterium SD302]|nr:hypothetical protein CEQ90_02145 [Lewinellaceae bacterium SD302]
MPEIGDSLYFRVADSASVQTVALGEPGGPLNWDLNTLIDIRTSVQYYQALEPGTQDDEFPQADFKLPTGDVATNYYQIVDGDLVLIGNIGASDILPDFEVTTPFSPGYVERRSPLEFIDNFNLESNILVSLPLEEIPEEILMVLEDLGVADGIDSVRFRTEIERTDLVDAYGTAQLGTESWDVLRERREEIRGVTVEAYNFILGWQDITQAIVLGLPQVGELLEEQDTVITYTLWSNESVDPIAVFEVEMEGEEEVVTGMVYIAVEGTSSTQETSLAANQVKMFPNPARNISTFQATGLSSGQYELRIHSTIGRKLYSQQFNVVGGSELRSEVDVSQFQSGVYLYSLINSRGRILATKRLFVGGVN